MYILDWQIQWELFIKYSNDYGSSLKISTPKRKWPRIIRFLTGIKRDAHWLVYHSHNVSNTLSEISIWPIYRWNIRFYSVDPQIRDGFRAQNNSILHFTDWWYSILISASTRSESKSDCWLHRKRNSLPEKPTKLRI